MLLCLSISISPHAAEVARRDVARIACEEMCAALVADTFDIAIFDGEEDSWRTAVLPLSSLVAHNPLARTVLELHSDKHHSRKAQMVEGRS